MGYRYDQYHAAVTSLGIATGQRFDANETAAFARQLEDIDSELYKVQYPELKGDKILPIRTAIDPGAEEYTYRVMDKAGLARVIANYAEDLPRVDVQGKEVTTKLFGLGASFGYSTQDLRRSRMLSVALDAERALAAREAIARKHDEILAHGDAAVGAKGFYNLAGVDLVSVGVTGTWSTATGDQIVADLLLMERDIVDDSNGVEIPDTVILSPGQYALASTKRLANTETTALEFFLKKSVGVKSADHWHRGSLADAGGTGPRIVMFKRDRTRIEGLQPLPFATMPPQQVGLGFVVACDGRAGGVITRYPKSMRYMDGC